MELFKGWSRPEKRRNKTQNVPGETSKPRRCSTPSPSNLKWSQRKRQETATSLLLMLLMMQPWWQPRLESRHGVPDSPEGQEKLHRHWANNWEYTQTGSSAQEEAEITSLHLSNFIYVEPTNHTRHGTSFHGVVVERRDLPVRWVMVFYGCMVECFCQERIGCEFIYWRES